MTPQNGSLPARVYVTELMGNETFVFVELANHRVVVRAPAEFPGRVDGTVNVSFDMRKALFFGAASGMRLT
jgi:ABC-type sugar transport system ATPase subunit